MSNMHKVDTNRKEQILAATITDNAKTVRYTIELEADGTDYHTIFKNQVIVVNQNNDLLLHSIMANLAIRGFVLREQVISFYSENSNCFISAGKRPIPAESVIPASELPKNNRLSLKVWPASRLPESMVLELDSRANRQQVKYAASPILTALRQVSSGDANADSARLLEATL